MARKSSTARKSGSNFEACAAECAAYVLEDDRIERRVKHGGKDTGDLSGLRIHGQRLVVECKDYTSRERMGAWLEEADVERGNDDSLAGAVLSHMRGVSADRRNLMRMLDQPVTMRYRDYLAMLCGSREQVVEREKQWYREHADSAN